MPARSLRVTLSILVLILLFTMAVAMPVFANEKENKYYLGEVVNTGKDNGYSDSKHIDEGDPHFGWTLGEFFVSGYSDDEKDNEGNSVFLKNVGDQITLWFCLKQDISKLNDNDALSISEDTNGYDQYFGIEKTNFEKGALIVRKKDFENHWDDPVIYTNYLAAQSAKGAYTQVDIFEEGDYEVALNYEIKQTKVNLFGWKPVSSYYNYRIFFQFSVRNGNCMVYPFDVVSGAELTNAAFTEAGFYLDLAQSKYLDINIKKEVLNESAEGLVEDVRFNKPAKDGEQFVDEGIYTITVTNEYTKQETMKKIYVGTNDILKAHVATGFSITEIKQQMSLGATVDETGELIPAPPQLHPEEEPITDELPQKDYILHVIVVGSSIIVILVVLIIVIKAKRNRAKKAITESNLATEKSEECDDL